MIYRLTGSWLARSLHTGIPYPGPRTHVSERVKKDTQTASVSDILTREMRWTLVDGMTAGRQHSKRDTQKQTDRPTDRGKKHNNKWSGWGCGHVVWVDVYVCVCVDL